MKILIVDYGAGNVESVHNSLLSIIEKFPKTSKVYISNRVEHLKSASHIILPGVGSFSDCMNGLKSLGDFLPQMHKQISEEKKPFLGVCVGMQVLASFGNENGEHRGLGLINGRVQKISGRNLKIPHMGWNNIFINPKSEEKNHKILSGIRSGDHFYFANSFHFICQNERNVLASVNYDLEIAAIVMKENIVGVQFHPEKSGLSGLRLLENFLDWRP